MGDEILIREKCLLYLRVYLTLENPYSIDLCMCFKLTALWASSRSIGRFLRKQQQQEKVLITGIMIFRMIHGRNLNFNCKTNIFFLS